MTTTRYFDLAEQFLYKAMIAATFFPRTIYRMIRHPVGTATYVHEQLDLPRDIRFEGMVKPPILLLLTLCIANLLYPKDDVTKGIFSADSAFGSCTSEPVCSLAWAAMYLAFALSGSLIWVVLERRSMTSINLKAPFYIHCYLLSPYALLSSLLTLVACTGHVLTILVSAALSLALMIWIFAAQTMIYSNLLRMSKWQGFFLIVLVWLLSAVIVVFYGMILFGIFGVPEEGGTP